MKSKINWWSEGEKELYYVHGYKNFYTQEEQKKKVVKMPVNRKRKKSLRSREKKCKFIDFDIELL